MLVGEYRLCLDDKGRLSLPAVWRHALYEHYAPHDKKLVVTRFFENCLVIYPEAVWREIEGQLLDLPNDASSRAFLRHFCASAHACFLDRQGRILVPPKLRAYAGVETEAMMIGVVRKLELWSPERWEAYEAEDGARFEAHARLMELRL